jgi:signal transduction histidine kinase
VPGGLRTKMALALVVIIGGAQAAAYLLVVPTLEHALVDARLGQLEKDAATISTQLAVRDASKPLNLQTFADVYAAGFNTRVVVFGVLGPPVALSRLADSFEEGTDAIEQSPTALEAARTGRVVSDTVRRGGTEYAEVAVPLLPSSGVMLLSTSLADQLATVRLVERRFLVATAVAVGIALTLGSIAAAMHARRIRRLERAANRIAEGYFDEPIADTGDDELGQLATAFDRMRLQLAQLDTARKEFVANASHELRTPLFSLAGFLELMDDEDLDEPTRREFLATTREQVDRLTRLAGDLLDLSRVDAGRLRVEREEVSVSEVAAVLAEELRPLAESTDHELTLNVDDDVWALADEERVLQVGRALAGNALAHTPPGTHVTIATRRAGDRVLLEVTDDGPGIAPEHLDRIFDRFYRVDGTQASGSGLGLAIARELAQHMGGAVSVETRPGRTSFVLALPADVIAAERPLPSPV